ncbi:MAG TPA: ATP-binding protein [Solirubrobacterales bacterium]|nr:ATP-binding protein [Solirubrobacterales bacterium]
MNARVERLEPGCPLGVCDGSGWVVDEDDMARPCECRARRIAQARMRGVRSVLPPKYQGVSFDRPPVSDMVRDPRTRAVVGQVRLYIDELSDRLAEGRGLWLTGDVGTGKTTLAMLVSKTAIESGYSAAIYSLPRLLARIRRTYDGEAGELSYLDFFRRLTSVDLLHIDDLGAEKRSDWVLEQLYAIVDERYVTNRAMVVTTNLDNDELEAQIGARTVSRLAEICGDPLPLFGEDQRYRVA